MMRSGSPFVEETRQLLLRRGLPLLCDCPKIYHGDCCPASIMQQLNRPEIKSTLTPYLQNQHYLAFKGAVVEFAKNLPSSCDYSTLIAGLQNQYEIFDGLHNKRTWSQKLELIGKPKIEWADAYFLHLSVLYMKRDVISHPDHGSYKFCVSLSYHLAGTLQE